MGLPRFPIGMRVVYETADAVTAVFNIPLRTLEISAGKVCVRIGESSSPKASSLAIPHRNRSGLIERRRHMDLFCRSNPALEYQRSTAALVAISISAATVLTQAHAIGSSEVIAGPVAVLECRRGLRRQNGAPGLDRKSPSDHPMRRWYRAADRCRRL